MDIKGLELLLRPSQKLSLCPKSARRLVFSVSCIHSLETKTVEGGDAIILW